MCSVCHRFTLISQCSLYKGLYPLWGRQIPYTMMKFASFENIVAAIYNYLPGSKSDYSKGAQTAVAFTGGYLAGILCAIVSHPADVMVSKLNADRQPGEGFGAAMSRIYGKIGFGGLWNGLPVRIVSHIPGLYKRILTRHAGHDWYSYWSPMDDLRHMQDLLRAPHDRWWLGTEEARLDGRMVDLGCCSSRVMIGPKNVHPYCVEFTSLFRTHILPRNRPRSSSPGDQNEDNEIA